MSTIITADHDVTYVADFRLSAMLADVDDGQPQDLHVSVEHRVAGPSLVALWQESGADLELTSGEGRQVALALLAAADNADGVTPAGPCPRGVAWCADGQHGGEHTATVGVTPVSLYGDMQLAVVLTQDDGEPTVVVEQVAGVEAATLTLDEAVQHALAVLRAVALAGGTK